MSGGNQADDERDELTPGTPLGPYDLISPIGSGGMARVWVARVRDRGTLVALKMLLPELAENVEFRKMFFDEARIASRIRHPNVCSTFELAEYDGTLFIAMEWLDGPSLMRVLRPGIEEDAPRVAIRPRIAARIVADACAGLHAAHELLGEDGRTLAVVHRDVSPHNLLLTTDGAVKITDFGVAKALGKSHMTIAGQLKGKVAYMAPEQLVGGPIDRRCDVFALGCVLYEITVGDRPFQGEHDPQVMAAIMLARFEPPSAVVPTYPKGLEAIVLKALANEPANRYGSAEEMRRALEDYLRASGPLVGPDQVAGLIHERCASELEERTKMLERRSMEASQRPRAYPAARSGSFDGAMAVGQPASGSRRGVVAVIGAMLVGVVLGVLVLGYVRSARKAKSAAETAAAASASALAASSADASTPAAPPSAGVSSTSENDAGIRSGVVRLRITPKGAVAVIEGTVLPPGTEAITRPTDGSTISVLVRADKHQDTIVLVDAATPDEVEVVLEPIAASGTVRPGIVQTDGGGVRLLRPLKEAGAPNSSGSAAPEGETPPNPYE